MEDTNNILSVLDGYLSDNEDSVSKQLASDFRHRRVVKNITMW